MASLRVIAFDHEGRPVQFDTWLDDLQLYLLSDSKDSVSLFDLVSGAATAPPATADNSTRSQWLTRDAAARLAICNHLPLTECAHFRQQRTAQALYDAVVARFSSPATTAICRLLLHYLFPKLSAFTTVEDLVSHLRASDARYRAAVPTEFLDRNPPPMYITLYFIVSRLPESLSSVRDHFLYIDSTSLPVDLLEQHLLAAESCAVAVGAARGTPRPPFFEGCSPSPLAPCYSSAAAADVSVPEDVGAAFASAKRRSSKGKGGQGGGGGTGGGGCGSGNGSGGSSGGDGGSGTVGGSGGSGGGGGGRGGGGGSGGGGTGSGGTGARRVGSWGGQRQQQQQRRSETPSPQQLREWFMHGASGGSCPYVIRTGDRACQTCGRLHTEHHCFSRLDDAWRAEFGDDVELPRWADLLKSRIAMFDLDFDAILSAMYALSVSAEGVCYRCVPPDPGIAAAGIGASESCILPGTALAEALHTFTLDSGASRCFFRDSTTLTPLPPPVPVRQADPSGGPVVARSSTVLSCPAVPSGSLSGLHLPSFSTNLVSTAALQDAMVTTTTPGGQRVSICTCTQTGRHLATFTRWPGSSLYTLTTKPSQVAASAQVFASGQVAASCSCRLLSHQALLWHHRLGHPSLPRLRGMHSRLLVSGLPRSLPSLPPSPAPPCLSCVEGRQRAAPHSSSFPSTSAPLKGQVVDVLISWICTVRLQLRERFGQDLPALRPHSDRGGEFFSNLLRDIYRGEGILQSFTLPDSPQQNGIAERRIGLVMEVDRTSMIHAASTNFLWLFAVRYAAHWLNLWPRVSLPETSPTLRWTGEVGDASVFRDVTFDESVPFYRLFPYRSAPPLPPPLFLAPGPPPVDPLLPQGPAPSSVSQVDPLPGLAPVQVAVDSGAARGAASGGADSEGGETGGAGPGGVETGGCFPEGAASEGAEPQGAASFGGSAGASQRLSPQQLREWFVRRTCLWRGASGAGGAGAARGGGPGVAAGAGVTGGTFAGGARVGGAGAAEVGAVDPRVGGSGDSVRPRLYFVPLLQQQLPLQLTSPLPAPSPYTEQSGGHTKRREPASRPVSPVCTARRVPRSRPPSVPGTHAMTLRPSSVPLRVPLPPPPESSLPEVPNPESDHARAASPTVSRLFTNAVTNPSFESTAASALVAELLDFAATCRLDYASALASESVSAVLCLSGAAMDGEMASWKSTGTYVYEVPPPGVNIVDGMWIFRVKRPPGSPPAFNARYVARGFSQRQGVDYFQTFSPTLKMTTLRVLLHVAAQRDYELHSLDSSTAFLQGSLHEEIWLCRLPGLTESFPKDTQWSLRRPVYGLRQAPREWHDTLRTTLAALGFAPATADSSLFLRTDTSLPLFYVLVYIHDLVFATADTEALTLVQSELQKRHTCTDLGELRSYLGLQITRNKARRTITLTQSHMVHQVLQRFGFLFSSPQPTPLSTHHSLTDPPLDESIELNGPYPELVGCLIPQGAEWRREEGLQRPCQGSECACEEGGKGRSGKLLGGAAAAAAAAVAVSAVAAAPTAESAAVAAAAPVAAAAAAVPAAFLAAAAASAGPAVAEKGGSERRRERGEGAQRSGPGRRVRRGHRRQQRRMEGVERQWGGGEEREGGEVGGQYDVNAADEAVGGRVEEQVAWEVAIVPEVDALKGTEGELAGGTGAIGWWDEDEGLAAPNAKAGSVRLGLRPEFCGGRGGMLRVRAEIEEEGGMEEGIAPKGGRDGGVSNEATGNFGDFADATLSNAILLRGVGKGGGFLDAMKFAKGGKGVVDELTHTVRVKAANGAFEVIAALLSPVDDNNWHLVLGVEEKDREVPTVVVNEDEHVPVPLTGADGIGTPEIHVDKVNGGGSKATAATAAKGTAAAAAARRTAVVGAAAAEKAVGAGAEETAAAAAAGSTVAAAGAVETAGAGRGGKG
ncbi:unnamed protein product, partial [Closterium sp. NIES-54]